MKEKNIISKFIKKSRAESKLTQKELALKAGVGLRFIRDVEQGKISLRIDTLNKVLSKNPLTYHLYSAQIPLLPSTHP